MEVDMNMDMFLISIFNSYQEIKVYINDADFICNKFENAYDAAWAVSLSGRWHWSDKYVYFDEDGYLTSFNHWDDENSPVDLDKLDICQLIQSLKKMKKRDVVNNIPRAIHEALEE